MGRVVLSSSTWDPAIGDVGMVQSCDRGGSDWTLRNVSLARGRSSPEKGLLNRKLRWFLSPIHHVALDETGFWWFSWELQNSGLDAIASISRARLPHCLNLP